MGNLCQWTLQSGNALLCLVHILLIQTCLQPATVVATTTASSASTIQPSFTTQPDNNDSVSANNETRTNSANFSHSILTTPAAGPGQSSSRILSSVLNTTSSVFHTTNSNLISTTLSAVSSKPADHPGTPLADASEQVLTSTTVRNGNGSCVGNETGCPEYRGHSDMALPTGAVVGIAVGAAVVVIIVVSCLVFFCRSRQSLSGSKADLSNYWDDNVTLSYINGHVDFPKDQPDEMISLDNDSFLNSLDNMSFTNVWTANAAKHTNF